MRSKPKFMKPGKLPLIGWINHIDAHHKLYASMCFAAIVFLFCYSLLEMPMLVMATWLSFLCSTLLLSWTTILSSHPADVRHEAHSQDSDKKTVFIFVVVASFASLFAVLFLLRGSDGLSARIFVPLVCVAGSWWLVHTVFTLRYAHFYYCDIEHDIKGGSEKPGGLEFAGEKEPDYLDFAYFSFVVGMTFQVSDVQISSRRIRRLAWMHGLLSFAFNTFIVAFAINLVAGLISK